MILVILYIIGGVALAVGIGYLVVKWGMTGLMPTEEKQKQHVDPE